MCFVLVAFQLNPAYPLIVAANREEARARPATPPFRWPEQPPLWAGRDELAGGTWLGVNGLGMLVAITNRRAGAPEPTAPSRGHLCLGALRQPSPCAARTLVAAQLAAARYNPFNLLCADVHHGWVGTWQGDTRSLRPGIHVLTSRSGLDDRRQPRVRRGLKAAGCLGLETAPLEALLPRLGALCADTAGPDPICRPEGERGTVSSSLIALGVDGTIAAYWHADGPPCEQPYRPVNLEAKKVP